jgi:hypothetical protein
VTWQVRKGDRKSLASGAREPFGISLAFVSRGDVEGNVEEDAWTWKESTSSSRRPLFVLDHKSCLCAVFCSKNGCAENRRNCAFSAPRFLLQFGRETAKSSLFAEVNVARGRAASTHHCDGSVREPFGISLTFDCREEVEGNVGDVARALAFRKDD